jgi:hypothetical protein
MVYYNFRRNKMASKRMTFTVALLLMLSMALSLVTLLPADAQGTVKTYPFINATPNPVQVGTETLLHIGISRPLILAAQGWEGITVTVTKPDNTNQTLGPFRTDSTGGTGAVLVPDQVGTYYLQTNFPAQWFNYTGTDGRGGFVSVSVYAQASTSDRLPLVVQSEPLLTWPGVPLPTEYWSRPIDAQIHEWAPIAGNWLDGNRRLPIYAPYNQGPETPHVLWTTPETTGGLVGGALDNSLGLTDLSFDMGDAYEGKFAYRLIIAGKLIYDKNASPDQNHTIAAIDLHTGEELWSKILVDNNGQQVLTPSGTGPTPVRAMRGQLMFWDTYDFHGIYDYLWAIVGSTWYAFDPYNGDWVYTMTNVPSGTITYGPKGEILIYTVDTARGWMTLWNSTNIPALYAVPEAGTMGYAQWRPMGKIVNAVGPVMAPFLPSSTPFNASGYMWNKTIPITTPGFVNYIYPMDRILLGNYVQERPGPMTSGIPQITNWAIDVSLGHEGALLFNTTWQTPASWVEGNQTIVFETVSPESKGGVFVIGARDNRQHYGFSTETGNYLWTTDPEIYLNWYGIGGIGGERPPMIAYNTLVTTGIGGIVYAYNTTSGQRIWTYNATDYFQETLFATNWWMYPVFITDGKLYIGNLEHSPVNPIPRGGPFIALDMATGREVFRIDGMFRQTLWGGLAVIGDSIIATQDTYDLRIYAIGKGPSTVTVSSPNIGVPKGSSVMITGTVTDISPGTRDSSLMMRFPHGVPAVSDESMSAWMLYVYKQFARPMNATGVPITIDVIDSNGNFRNIGNATSDSNGKFVFSWTPDITGSYTVIATFAGSKSYYPSYDLAYFGVEEASSQPTATPTTGTATMVDQYFIPAVVAIIIAIAIVGALILAALRRRP